MTHLHPVSENYGANVLERPEVLTWDVVNAVRGNLTERAQVHGGWLYRTTVVHDDGQVACAMTFVAEGK